MIQKSLDLRHDSFQKIKGHKSNLERKSLQEFWKIKFVFINKKITTIFNYKFNIHQ